MSYHFLGDAAPAPAPSTAPSTAPATVPSTAVVVADTLPPSAYNPVTVTIGIPGLNAVVPLTSPGRIWLAVGMSVVVGIVGGIGLAALIKKAQK